MQNYYDAIDHQRDEYGDIEELLGERMEIEDAAEPTDIIWENRHFTSAQRLQRALIVVGISFFLLMISFVIIYVFSVISASLYFKYPSTVDCEQTSANYNNNLEGLY